MKNYTKKTVEELQKDLAEKREALREFRFSGAGSRSRNVRAGRTLRTEIARILTTITAKGLQLK